MRNPIMWWAPILVAVVTVACMSLIAQAASVTVGVGSVEAASGEQVDIPITLEDSPGIVAMHLELTYDPAVLAVVAVEKGALLVENALLESNADTAGRLVVGFASLAKVEGSDELVTVRFSVNGETGQASVLALENGRAWMSSGIDVVVTMEDGELVVGTAASSIPVLPIAAASVAVLLFLGLLLLLRRQRGTRPQPVPSSAAQNAPAPPAGEQAKFCSRCGNPLAPDASFCSKCGQRVMG